MGKLAYAAPLDTPIQQRIGIAALTHAAFTGDDLTPLASRLLIEYSRNPMSAGALMDLSMIEQLRGNLRAGLDYQSAALEISQVFSIKKETPTNLRLLVLAAPIRMGGNTPVEFLLEGTSIAITTLFVLPNKPLPSPLPEHDLVFVAAPGDADHTRRFLLEIQRHLKKWRTPVLNQKWRKPVLNHPEYIIELERDRLCNTLSNIPNLVSPLTVRCARSTLMEIRQTDISLEEALPIVVRPVGSHAGRNLEKITNLDDVDDYLNTCTDQEFFVTQFLDYRSTDGLFRKYRIVFVDGHPFACHMAISDQWKIWYLNAEMEKSPEKLAEEEGFMSRFDIEFGARHKKALDSIAQQLNLEYFGIDCAETPEGELVVFEADNALLVHDMDPKDIYPYKAPQMKKVFTAFEEMLRAKIT